MSDAAAVHPSQQELAAFGVGRLGAAAATAVAAHLEGCPACRRALEGLPPDSFLGKVRAARPGGPSLPPAPPPAGGTNLPTGAAAPAPPAGLPAELAGYTKYRFVRELGRGGMGVVYLAVQTLMGRPVAVKVINPAVLAHAEALPRFQAEVRAAARLDHPHIVRAYDAEQVGGLHLLVMEFVEGTSLAGLVQRKGPLPVMHACHYARQAALGLQHAFEQGMVHRDVKPSNLMVSPRGVVKVLDFGLARLRSERARGGGLTQVDSFMGTPEYVAPEQATDARSADIRADIYSLGCTLYFLLTGHPPFQEGTAVKLVLAHIEKEPAPLHEVRPDVPAGLAAVVARMLAKDPARRYQTPVEVAQALAAFIKPGARREAGGCPPPVPAVGSPSRGTVISGDTSKLRGILREVPGEAPTGEPPAKDETANPFEELGDPRAPPKRARTAAEPAGAAWYQRPTVQAGLLAAMVTLGLGLLAATIAVYRLQTDNGELVITTDDPDVQILIRREGKVVRTVDTKTNKEVKVKLDTGLYELELKGRPGGVKLSPDRVTIRRGETVRANVKLLAKPKPACIKLYLSDLDEFDWKGLDFSKNKKCTVNGVEYRKMVYMHPPSNGSSRIKYRINNLDASAFEAKVGILDTVPAASATALTFQVVGDDTVLWSSKPIKAKGDTQDCSVPLEGKGIRVLELRVVCPGWHGWAHAVWLDAYILASKRKTEEPRRQEPATDGFVRLFNGKDLTGWNVSGDPRDWQALGGIITGSRRTWGPTALVSKRAYGDFHLRVETMLAEGNNSFIQFRQGLTGWYVVQIDGTNDLPGRHTGDLGFATKGLTAPTPLAQADPVIPLKPGEWFTIEVKAIGANTTVLVEGKAVVTFEDKERRFSSGVILLVCRGKSKVHFRKIEIKELPPTRPEAPTPPSAEVLTPAEAARKEGQKVTVQFRVQGTGWNPAGFVELYSEPIWHRPGNFFIRFPESTRKKFQELGVADVARHFHGKQIRVTGTVTTLRFGGGEAHPCIQVDDPGQIRVTEVSSLP